MSFSLMNAQMIRVISSPSSSTIGFTTLIFGIGLLAQQGREGEAGGEPRPEIAGNIASRHGGATPLFGRAAARRLLLHEAAEGLEIGGIEVGDGPIGHPAVGPVNDVVALPLLLGRARG